MLDKLQRKNENLFFFFIYFKSKKKQYCWSSVYLLTRFKNSLRNFDALSYKRKNLLHPCHHFIISSKVSFSMPKTYGNHKTGVLFSCNISVLSASIWQLNYALPQSGYGFLSLVRYCNDPFHKLRYRNDPFHKLQTLSLPPLKILSSKSNLFTKL